MAEFRDYLTFLESLQKELEKLNGIEQRKIAAVRAGDLETLDACMKQEQAASLSLRGQEQRREALLTELGMQGVSLRELAEHAPQTLRAETAQKVEALLRTYQVLSSSQSAARTMMEANLHRIEKQLDQLFQGDTMDITADVDVLEQMLARDGLTGEQLRL